MGACEGIPGHYLSPESVVVWRPSYVQALNQRRKGAQTQAWGKRPKVAKAWARGQRLMGDMQLGPPQTGFRNCKDMSPPQSEGNTDSVLGQIAVLTWRYVVWIAWCQVVVDI